MSHPLDDALLATLPVVPMPRYGSLMPLTSAGQRLLVGRNGVFMEVRRAWLHAIVPCGELDAAIALPYGDVVPKLDLPYGPVPKALVDAFIEVARQHLPNEVAGGVVFDELAQQFELRIHGSEAASEARVDYRTGRLGEHEVMMVDLHSHGRLPAVFSAQDDRDDAGSTKVAVVVGGVESSGGPVQFAVRICLNGLLLHLDSGYWTGQGGPA
jgi:PRTRC genetic system protein A